MSTITGKVITSEVYLDVGSGKYVYASPLTITSTGTIAPISASEAIYADGSTPWTVVNFGVVTVNGNAALRARGAAGIVVNSGKMDNGSNFSGGIELYNGGTVINSGTGLIQGELGVYITGTSGVVSNSATIAGGVLGLSIIDGAVVTNTGLITAGGGGIDFYAEGAGTIINSGTIIGKGTSGNSFQNIGGIELKGGGSVTNSGSGLIRGNIGIYINGAGMVTNSGTIIGSASIGVDLNAGGTVIDSGLIRAAATHPAISFGGPGDNRLVLENGYALKGAVTVSGTANTLELSGAAGPITVNFDKASAGFTSFGTVAFDPPSGSAETLEVTKNTSLPGMISGFTGLHEVVDLTHLQNGTIGGGTLNGSDQLVVSNGALTVTLQLDPSENYSGIIWQTTPDNGVGTDIEPACFCRGTLILTPDGDVPIEHLAIGDMVVTAVGIARPIKWIGRRGYAARFASSQRHILPICVAAGALADGIPSRDLWLSPNHALYLERVLIEARDVVNGTSISQPPADRSIEYFHLELDSHDLIFAEGAIAESYSDDDNRLLFHNAHEYWTLYPDAADGPAQYCARRLAEGVEVARARAAIDRRAGLKIGASRGGKQRQPALYGSATGPRPRIRPGTGPMMRQK